MINIDYNARTMAEFFRVNEKRFDKLNKTFKCSPSRLQEYTSIKGLLKTCENIWNKDYPDISFQEKIVMTIALGIDLNYLCSPKIQQKKP